MQVSFYKEYFEIKIQHASAPGKSCTSFSIKPAINCGKTIKNYRMDFRTSPGEAILFYSGVETADHSHILSPLPVIPDETEFLFIISVEDKNIIKKTKIPVEPDIQVEDLEKVIPWQFIRPAVFSYTFDQSASTNLYEQFILESEKGNLVYETTIKKDKEINGVYVCPVDMSISEPGIYKLKLGTKEKKFYIDTVGEMGGSLGFMRFRKKATWLKPVNLLFGIPVDYNQFVYTFDSLP